MKYPVFIEKESGSDFGVTVPDLPGCYSAGSTIEEALENAQKKGHTRSGFLASAALEYMSNHRKS
ncbi:MAG TPA: hypothetical protein GXZ47_06500 [Treponema sp.]|nr:hypothetical protein [Treponema sp.]